MFYNPSSCIPYCLHWGTQGHVDMVVLLTSPSKIRGIVFVCLCIYSFAEIEVMALRRGRLKNSKKVIYPKPKPIYPHIHTYTHIQIRGKYNDISRGYLYVMGLYVIFVFPLLCSVSSFLFYLFFIKYNFNHFLNVVWRRRGKRYCLWSWVTYSLGELYILTVIYNITWSIPCHNLFLFLRITNGGNS